MPKIYIMWIYIPASCLTHIIDILWYRVLLSWFLGVIWSFQQIQYNGNRGHYISGCGRMSCVICCYFIGVSTDWNYVRLLCWLRISFHKSSQCYWTSHCLCVWIHVILVSRDVSSLWNLVVRNNWCIYLLFYLNVIKCVFVTLTNC